MHELSIVMSIAQIATEQLEQTSANSIDEIELDIGCLTTIEMDSFHFAWNQGVKNTALQCATLKVNRIEGNATCLECNCHFPMQHLYDSCPMCNSHFLQINQGKELKVKAITVSN